MRVHFWQSESEPQIFDLKGSIFPEAVMTEAITSYKSGNGVYSEFFRTVIGVLLLFGFSVCW